MNALKLICLLLLVITLLMIFGVDDQDGAE